MGQVPLTLVLQTPGVLSRVLFNVAVLANIEVSVILQVVEIEIGREDYHAYQSCQEKPFAACGEPLRLLELVHSEALK